MHNGGIANQKSESGYFATLKCEIKVIDNSLCLCFKTSPCKTFDMKISLICVKMNL